MKPTASVVFLLLGITTLIVRAEETDPKVILQKAGEVTNQLKSLKQDTLMETFAASSPQKGVIYQKVRSDGSLLMRSEMSALNSNGANGYTLITPEGAYMVLQSRIIKMDGLVQGSDKLKEIMGSMSLRKVFFDPQGEYTLSTGTVEGKDCWIISQTISSAALESARKSLEQGPQKELLAAVMTRPEAIPIPIKNLSYFDKKTYFLLKQESVDKDNKTIIAMTFQNLQPNLDLPDTLFKLPDNVPIEDMNSLIQGIMKNPNTVK